MNSETIIKAFVTKYWESAGLIEVEGYLSTDGFLDLTDESRAKLNLAYHSFGKNDLRITMEDAAQHANTLKMRKIKALEDRIVKLKAVTF